ncbi:MAG: hypothetical protein JO146_00305 [Candidatus Eremiobacteraeota bacterium]|nr:hypothetical protein [Candidatus Eremiobacteraeota bacterium]
MSAPIPAPDDPTPIDPIENPPLDPTSNDPSGRDSSQEGPWRPGEPGETESGT